MNLEEARRRPFDDILYMGLHGYLKLANPLPPELVMTDADFMENVFKLYNTLEAGKITILHHPKRSGFTTALSFIISYYALHHKSIHVLTNPGRFTPTFMIVNELFNCFLNFKSKVDDSPSSITFKYEDEQYSRIKLHNSIAFELEGFAGPIIFDNSKPLQNLSKFETLIDNQMKYDKIIINFPDGPEINKLAEKIKTNIKEIKIL